MDAAAETELLNMDLVKIDPKWALMVPGNLAIRKQLLPFAEQGGRVLVACRDPEDAASLQAVERYVSASLEPLKAEAESLERVIVRIFQDQPWRSSQANAASIAAILAGQVGGDDDPDSETAVALSDDLFHAALIRQATDVHIEPRAHDVRIRLRVDGVLEDYRSIPAALHGRLISRLKVLCGMDIAERRAPQDGRLTLPIERGQEVDVRAATIPTKHGERMTLRLLAQHRNAFALDDLGISAADLPRFRAGLSRPHGLILVTGPTGCGKSTTLYSALRHLIASRPLNVITIENPVECLIDGISQVEVDLNDKVSFHKALRSVLRHDPDVLMIGEIRDEETAEIAIRAALTGHLVLTTLHANSAAGSVTRLIDMGVKPFLVGAVTRAAVAQRLVRRLCAHCRHPEPLAPEQAAAVGRPELAGASVSRSAGCKYCAHSGFKGRIGLFEFVFFDEPLAQLVAQGVTEMQFQSQLRLRRVPTLLDDGIDKLLRGEVSADEVAAVMSLR